MWRSSAKLKGIRAATAGIIVAISSWRSWFGTERHRETINESPFSNAHLPVAKCTDLYSVHSEVRPVDLDEAPNIKIGNPVTSLSSTEKAIARCRRLVRRVMLERGIPGAVVAVVKDGETVWSEGFGYADVENDVPCTPDTPMRIASISKPLTAVALLQLWQKGLVDLDAPVQTYVPEFPEKEYNGEKVAVTTRQLLSHMAGIRHYAKVPPQKDDSSSNDAVKEFEQKEYYIKTHFDSVLDSLKLFADDDLISKPGSEYNYTTHGWTLISAVLEKVSNKQFLEYMDDHIFKPLGMTSTGGEFQEPLLYNRARYYVRRKNGLLQNTPYVDISYKWAGGGLISTVHDLTKFGNALLTCYRMRLMDTQCHDCVLLDGERLNLIKPTSPRSDDQKLNCILDADTISMMWTPVVFPYKSKPQTGYAMGWVVRGESAGTVGGRVQPFVAAHSGGTVGASSALVIMPATNDISLRTVVDSTTDDLGSVTGEKKLMRCDYSLSKMHGLPRSQGVVVAVLFNLQEVTNVTSVCIQIAEEFL